MHHVYIEDIADYDGQEVTIKGWLYNKRSSGKVQFHIIRDGTGIIQGVIAPNAIGQELYQKCDRLPQESSVILSGRVRADERAPGGYELDVTQYEIIHEADEYPITPKEHGTAFLMDHRHLWLRSSKQQAIIRVRSEVVKACRDFYDERGFVLVDAPIFTPAACEGTSTLFETEYFDTKAYLTQSGQLYMEAGAMAFGKVYCFGPTFRAEKSKTRRHLTEFWMIEPEVAYLDLEGDMRLAEEMIVYIVQRVLERRHKELKTMERDTAPLEKVVPPFPRIRYDEAVAQLVKDGLDVKWGDDFGGDEETVLSQQFDKPLIVHRFPKAIKAFYMKTDPEDGRLALGMDVLAPEGYGEIVGGGQREDDLKVLGDKIEQHHLPVEAFQWYLDLRRYGTVPHSGFGLGVERTVAWICGIPHIRETVPFPRLMHRLYP
ncbi:MAG: asparagine--tRNA ligase [Gemmatimonadota bacterium]|nr:MAG: asparagine--tRNA ligase [Gemmatimonadota bacterium]